MKKRPKWLAVLAVIVVLIPDIIGSLINAVILAAIPTILLLFASASYGNWFTTTLLVIGVAGFLLGSMIRAAVVSFGTTSGAFLGAERLLYGPPTPPSELDPTERNAP